MLKRLAPVVFLAEAFGIERLIASENNELLPGRSTFFSIEDPGFFTFRNKVSAKIRQKIEDEIEADSCVLEDAVDLLALELYRELTYFGADNLSPENRLAAWFNEPLLNIRNFFICCIKVSRIPCDALGLFPGLRTLAICSCQLTDDVWITELGSYLPNLERLYLFRNEFTKIPDLSSFQELKFVDLNWNQNIMVDNVADVRLFPNFGVILINVTNIAVEMVETLRKRFPNITFVD